MASNQEKRRMAGRERVLTVGLNVLEREGLEAVTVRRIAAELGCTPPVIYQHFTNKEALLAEIIALGFDRLAARTSAAAVGAPTERILRAAREYIASAFASPHLYRLMMSTSILAGAQRQRAAARIAQETEALLANWADHHHLALDVERAGEILWATLHGVAHIAVLTGAHRLESSRLADASVESLLAGWCANSPSYLAARNHQLTGEKS